MTTMEPWSPEIGDRVYEDGQCWFCSEVAHSGLVTNQQGRRARDVPLDDLAWDEALEVWMVLPEPDEETGCL